MPWRADRVSRARTPEPRAANRRRIADRFRHSLHRLAPDARLVPPARHAPTHARRPLTMMREFVHVSLRRPRRPLLSAAPPVVAQTQKCASRGPLQPTPPSEEGVRAVLPELAKKLNREYDSCRRPTGGDSVALANSSRPAWMAGYCSQTNTRASPPSRRRSTTQAHLPPLSCASPAAASRLAAGRQGPPRLVRHVGSTSGCSSRPRGSERRHRPEGILPVLDGATHAANEIAVASGRSTARPTSTAIATR